MPSTSKKVILAEDDEEDALLFTELLSEINQNIVVTVVSNGVMLMTLLAKTTHPPDFIFLDINMPLKNGLQCLKEIKTDDKLRNIRTIILSTSSEPKQIEESYRHGAHLYVTKPPSYTAFKSVLAECIQKANDLKADQSNNQFQ